MDRRSTRLRCFVSFASTGVTVPDRRLPIRKRDATQFLPLRFAWLNRRISAPQASFRQNYTSLFMMFMYQAYDQKATGSGYAATGRYFIQATIAQIQLGPLRDRLTLSGGAV